ncbi:hypothetical protein LX66_0215 [Chitinophaga japonensis]|uniref:Uncharacterized protein n=1 Tax=Chitinophaga japonensis TaxID=104662 RepID=A0A562TBC2_CHIJA|nr:hypothetical protein LX66_0215 [Chitinophaga japonensis]
MGAPSLDSEFMQYWLRLTSVEKESLLSVAKHYVALKDEVGRISIKQYNQEIEAAMERIDAGEFYTHEQVVEMSKNWLSGR